MDFLSIQLSRAERGIMFDTNVLLVYLVGIFDVKLVSRFKKTAAYSSEDFSLLQGMVLLGRGLVVTPHVLAETCNHIDKATQPYRNDLYTVLQAFIEATSERRQEARRLSSYHSFPRVGISDISLLDASLKSHLIVTDDSGCYTAIEEVGGLVINFNHLRSSQWLG